MSNRNPPNQLGGFLDDIEEIGRVSRRSGEELSDINKLQNARSAVREIQKIPGWESNPNIVSGYKHFQGQINRLDPRTGERELLRSARLNTQAQNAVRRDFDSVNGQAITFGSSATGQQMSMGLTNVPQRELEARRGRTMNAIDDLRERALSLSGSSFDSRARMNEDTVGQLAHIESQKRRHVQQLGIYSAAERRQKRLGLDEQSQIDRLMESGQKAQNTLFSNAVRDELKSGGGLGAMNVDQLKQKETQAANDLVQALEKLKNSANESAENVDKLKEQAEGSAEHLRKIQEAIKLGGGSGGGGRNLNNYALFGSALGAGASAVQNIALNQPLQVLQNQTGFANLSNQMYDQRNRAIGGNMLDLLMASNGSLNMARSAGTTAYGVAQGVQVANAVSGGVQAGVGAAKAYYSGGLAGGAGDIIAGGSQMAGAIGDMSRGVTAGSYSLANNTQTLARQREVSYVSGDQLQKLYDYSMSSRQAALAAGGRGSAYFEQYAGNGGVNQLAKMESAGIGADQFAALAGRGFAEQGSAFNPNQVFAARNLERSGMGDMGTNMSRMAALAAGGSNNPQAGLQSVLEAAFSKSLDSSKALNLVAEHTGAMAQGSVAATVGGQDVTGVSSAILSNMVNRDNPNQEMAVNRAATAAQTMNGINSSTGRSFADMVGVSAIARAGGVGQAAAINLKSLDDASAAQLLKDIQGAKGDPNKSGDLSKRLTDQLGLGAFVQNGKVNFSGLEAGLKQRSLSGVRQAALIANVDPNLAGYNKLASGTLTMEELESNPAYGKLRQQVGESARLMHLSTQELLTGGRAGDTSSGAARADGGIGGTLDVPKSFKDADAVATAAAENFSKQARLAATELGGVATALEKISGATKELNKKLNDASADDFRTAAGKAASDFKLGADVFAIGVDHFETVVKKLAVAQGIRLPDTGQTKKHGSGGR